MSKLKSIVAAAAIVLALPVIAGASLRIGNQAESLDSRAFPNLTQIYVASGVRDNGGASETGVATVIHCTNFTAAQQQLRILIRNWNNVVVTNNALAIPSLNTVTLATHNTNAFSSINLTNATTISQGSLRIFATAPQITCTAMVIDASTVAPIGTNLHVVRHNAWANTQE